MKNTIVIAGAGLAGLSAALQAADEGCNVKLISSAPSERAQSVMAEGGINAALNTKGENDSPQQHFEDTMRAGCDLADPGAVRDMTEAAPGLVQWLHKAGVQFNTIRHSDSLDLRSFGGQKKKRTAFAQSETGKQIMTALIDAVRQKEAEGLVARYSHHDFRTLLLHKNACCGCVIRDTYTGILQRLYADAVIIATGGMHGLFGNTTGSVSNTGEVTAELFRLGVPIANPEMIQYHPTTVPIGGRRILITEAARAEGGRLFTYRDGKPWYFMEEKYPELGNLMPRDITAREIWNINRESDVFLDMTAIPADAVRTKLAGLADDCLTYLHTDIRKTPIRVSPGIHYFMGGIYVDKRHRTDIQHLYAAGECCAQYHGANRLGGNSLLGALYGGRIAAQTACEELSGYPDPADIGEPSVPDVSDLQKKHALNRVMLQSLGVVRDEKTMRSGLEQLQQINGSLSLLGQACLKSALARKESRGAHWREDYPQRNDAEYKKTTVARYTASGIRITFEDIPKERRQKGTDEK